jgi:hypothetical protein
MDEPSRERESSGVSVMVIRDAVLIFGFTVIGTFVVGFIVPTWFGGLLRFISIASTTIAGFTFSACLIRGNRWIHLILVAFGYWIMNWVLSIILAYEHPDYARSINILFAVFLVFEVFVAGGLSYLFKRNNQTSV